jgi:hypothetical protein
MFEPGTGDMLEAPTTVADFHDGFLGQFGDEALAEAYFLAWQATTGTNGLAFTQCVGYKKQLFLGGEDGLANLEVTDLEVYWSLSAQIWAQVRDLPTGSPIGETRID